MNVRSQGESFGERSLVTGNPVSATIQAAEDVELLRLDPAAVQQLLDRSSDLREALVRRIDQDREFDFLRTLPFFAGLERTEIGRLLEETSLRRLAAGEFLFHEGDEAVAQRAFKEIARLTRGAYCSFDASSAGQLRDLLSAVAVYAAGGQQALQDFSRNRGEVLRQLTRQLDKR